MSSHDEHIEKRFETGKRISIEMGTKVLMLTEGVARCLSGTITGVKDER